MRRFGLIVVLYLAVVGPILVGRSATGQSGSWLSANLVLSDREETAVLPESILGAGNIPCRTRTFTTRPAVLPLQPAVTASACAVQTSSGWTASGGYTTSFGDDARLLNDGGGALSFYAVPGGSGGVMLENTASGSRMHYYAAGVHASRREYNSATRELKIFLSNSPTWTLKDRAGKLIHVRSDSLAISDNGMWLVADIPFLATIRVNLASGEITPFSAPYNYHLGFSVTPNLAISNDGRFALRSSDSGDLKVTDLSTCAAVPNSITGPVSCQSAAIDTQLRAQVPGYWRVYQPRFLSDRQLSLFISYSTAPASRALAKFRLSLTGGEQPRPSYLALGDSFSSGEGAYDYFPETDTEGNRCHLSRRSYPYLVGRRLEMRQFNSVACSGAKIQDITTYVQKTGWPSPNSMGSLLPGYRKQIDYVRDLNPLILSVGISGNDAGLPSRLKTCLGIGTCFESYEDRLEIIREINDQFPRLVDMFEQLQTTTSNDTRVFAVGYPRIADAYGRCGVTTPLNSQERLFVNQTIDHLNKVIEQASRRAGISFIDVSDVFKGHQLCAGGAEKLAMHAVVLGNDFPLSNGPFGNESFHPTAFGHQLYAEAIAGRLANFSTPKPIADTSAGAPSESADLPLLQAPKSNRAVHKTVFDGAISPDVLVRQTPASLIVSGIQHGLQPGTSYTVELHSEPQVLTNATVQPDGNIQTAVIVPENVAPGYHTLHIKTTTINGQRQDIYKAVYVAAGTSDIDGDGITNHIDSCNGYPNLNQDHDQDGLDDACDDEISAPGNGNQNAVTAPIETITPTEDGIENITSEDGNQLGVWQRLTEPLGKISAWQPRSFRHYFRVVALVAAAGGIGILYVYNRRR